MFNSDISNAENGRSCVALTFGVMMNMNMLKETRKRLVINGYYYTQSFNKSQEYNIECDGYIFWKTHMENLSRLCEERLQKYVFEPHYISVYIWEREFC
jgi:hypothetical protein